MADRLGVLYPGHSGERDYDAYAQALGVRLDLLHTTVGEDLHETVSLLAIGEPQALLKEARIGLPSDIGAVVWACTSGSFVFGWQGAQNQVRTLSAGLGVPATSTSLAFVNAVLALGLRRVAIAGTYPRPVSNLFAGFLADAGLEVVDVTSAGVMTGAEVGLMDAGDVTRMIEPLVGSGADAILVPDTALHSFQVLPSLEDLGSVVLTANQVTMWAGIHLLDPGWQPDSAARRALGVLHGVTYLSTG